MAVYFMNNNQRVIKVVGYEALREVTQTQELPDDGSLLKDMLTVSAMNDERLDDAQYMAVKSYTGNKQSFDMYRIVSQRTEQNWTTFDGVQLAYYELAGAIIEDIRPKNAYINELVPRLLNGTDWTLGYVDDNLPEISTHIYYLSVKDALAKVQSVTGVEMIFKVEISGNQVTDKWVEVYERLGDKTLKRFNYGTNALTVVRETSHQDLYTALIGRGKGEEVSSAEDNESGQAGYGRKITFRDVEWSKGDGDPLDKPSGQLYLEQPEATAAYGIQALNGEKLPRVGIVEFSDTEDPDVLIQQTYEALEYYARPKVLFKASVVNIGATGIGDTVTIHRHDLNIHYQTRVRKVIRDKINDNRTQVELGDVVHTSSTKKQANINSALNNLDDTIRDTARNEILPSLPSANGVNQNFYQNEEPERKRTGDLWYRDHPSLAGHRQLLMWNGEAWELLSDTSDKEQVNRRVDEQEELLEKYAQDLITTTELANNVSEKASQLEQTYQDVKASTDSAMNKAVDAYTDAQSALASIGDLDRTVTNHGASILQNERNISLKANQTDVDTLNEIIETNSAELSVLAGEISSKVDQQTVDNLNQTVDSLSAEQVIQAGKISERLTRTEVNAEIERRVNDMAGGEFSLEGFAEVEYVENLIENTADSFSQSIESVRKLVPTSYENRNLAHKGTLEGYSSGYTRSGDVFTIRGRDAGIRIKPDTFEANTSYVMSFKFRKVSGTVRNMAGHATGFSTDRVVLDGEVTGDNWSSGGSNPVPNDTDTHTIEVYLHLGNSSQTGVYIQPNRATYSDDYELDIWDLQLEKGTVATDWSPPPEDLQNDLTILRSDYERTAEEITDRLTKIDGSNGYISEIRRDVGSLTRSITEYEEGTTKRFNVIESDVEGTRQLVADLENETSSQFNIMSDEISAVVGKVNNIGGRNLYQQSRTRHGWHTDQYSLDFEEDVAVSEWGATDAIRLRLTQGGSDARAAYNVIRLASDPLYAVGEDYIVSGYIKNNHTGNTVYVGSHGNGSARIRVAPGDSKYFEFPVKLSGSSLIIGLYPATDGNDVNVSLWNIKVEKGTVATPWSPAPEDGVSKNELISEINLQADRQIFRVGDNRLMITEDTTYLDNSVIKSAHIADLAVTGAKIAEASISSAKIISLDADQITGNTTNFIKSNWNNISTQISIDDRGINVTGSDQWRRTYFNQTGFELFNGSGAYNKAGVMGYFKPSLAEAGWDENVMNTTRGGTPRHYVGLAVNHTHDLALGYSSNTSTDRIFEPALEIRGTSGDVRVVTMLDMDTKNIEAINTAKFRGRIVNHRYEIGTWDDRLTFHGQTGFDFYSQGNLMFSINVSGYSNLYSHLNMRGFDVYNQSDERLKTNIMPSFKDSLGRFNKAKFKWFEYLSDHDLAGGLHHGLIAQEVLEYAPEWVLKDEQGYYSINQSAMQMDAFKAIQQLSQKVKKLEEQLNGRTI